MRRLFSTFARGSPGAGLLLMRLVAGIALVVHGVTTLRGQTAIGAVILQVPATGAGILLLAGLWTPIAGTLVTLIELRSIFSEAGDPWIYLLLGTLGAALALLGPGGWSVDAYLFGWKRIDPPDRKS
jgi:putative oxidoreductase